MDYAPLDLAVRSQIKTIEDTVYVNFFACLSFFYHINHGFCRRYAELKPHKVGKEIIFSGVSKGEGLEGLNPSPLNKYTFSKSEEKREKCG